MVDRGIEIAGPVMDDASEPRDPGGFALDRLGGTDLGQGVGGPAQMVEQTCAMEAELRIGAFEQHRPVRRRECPMELAQRLERTGMIAPAQRRLGCALQVDVQMIQRLAMLAQRQQPEDQVEARLRIRRVTPDKQASLFDRGGEIAHHEQECLPS